MIIYKATNKINGKVYIGQTEKTLEHRKEVHHRDSERMDTYFYRAIRKYGWENFKWEVIDDSATTREELNALEQYYIAKYQSFDNKEKGYNSTSGGEYGYQVTHEQREARSFRVQGDKNPFSNNQGVFSWKGKKFSPEHKKHISESLKGRPAPWAKGGNSWCAKPIVNLMTLKQYPSIQDASRAEGITADAIGNNLHSKTEYCKGCKWAYLEDIKDVSSLAPLPRKMSRVSYKIFCPETNVVYQSLAEANKHFHFATKVIKECCVGKRESYQGYHFQFLF